jgi:hypothetical protein
MLRTMNNTIFPQNGWIFDSKNRVLLNVETQETRPYTHIHFSDKTLFRGLAKHINFMDMIREAFGGKGYYSANHVKTEIGNLVGRAKILVKYPEKLNPMVGVLDENMMQKYKDFVSFAENTEEISKELSTEVKNVRKFENLTLKLFLEEMKVPSLKYYSMERDRKSTAKWSRDEFSEKERVARESVVKKIYEMKIEVPDGIPNDWEKRIPLKLY